ncbi:MAG: hypothetical protein B6I28_06445 [Fusobacteriia bacterium 4572_132]|nr:MAG: hypothetical protein B6I28_06445 [Fusobacteriia bacterium 4572_132]
MQIDINVTSDEFTIKFEDAKIESFEIEKNNATYDDIDCIDSISNFDLSDVNNKKLYEAIEKLISNVASIAMFLKEGENCDE